MTIIMHVVQIKTYFYLHLLEAKKKNPATTEKKTILSGTHMALTTTTKSHNFSTHSDPFYNNYL